MRLSSPISLLATLAAATNAASILTPREGTSLNVRATTPEQLYDLCGTTQGRLWEDYYGIQQGLGDLTLPWNEDLAEMNQLLARHRQQTRDLSQTIDEMVKVTKRVADRAGAA